MTRPDDLAAHCIQDLLSKTPKLDPTEIEDVVLGCGQPHGPQGHNVARIAAMVAGLAAFRRGDHRQQVLLFRAASHRHGGAPDYQ